ncbi:MAG: LLM class flavin-dependent oxidoreductase [Porticoccaceae bacterium]
MKKIKFGLFLPTGNFADAKAAALQAERDGFYSVSTNDHFFSPLGAHETPQLECFTSLTAIAALTSTIRLAPSVVAASYRNPALLAKISSTLDQISNGRFILGLGAGWFGAEYRAHGYPFPSTAERLAQLEETVQVLKAMWCDAAPTFTGNYFSIAKAYNNPRPVQQPHPPLMLGGSGTGLLKIAAAHADILNMIPPTSNGKDFVNDPAATVKYDMGVLKRKIAELQRYAEAAGRDPGDIELSGFALVGLSRDAADKALRGIATQIGFPDYATAQRSPVALLGTPGEVVNELRTRIEQTGMTYHILLPMSAESHALFVNEVMPSCV